MSYFECKVLATGDDPLSLRRQYRYRPLMGLCTLNQGTMYSLVPEADLPTTHTRVTQMARVTCKK